MEMDTVASKQPLTPKYIGFRTPGPIEMESPMRRSTSHVRARRRAFAASLACGLGIGPRHRVLELGAGFGRFSFPLLEHCGSLVAVDLSPRVLASLARTRDERGIPESRCRVHCSDLDALDAEALGAPFDFVVGFFLLHHLSDFPRSIRALGTLLAPGGGMAFVEPNRRNPLFLAQVAACPDMTWREEKGMFALSASGVESAYRSAALERVETRRFGFFPPQILNNIAPARRFEHFLERRRSLRWVLPFLLLSARSPEAGPE